MPEESLLRELQTEGERMTDYDKLEELRQMARSNHYAQLSMMGYDSGGNPLDDIVRVVRCKDCIQRYYASNRVPQERTWTCSRLGITVKDDWYCADGERREELK